MLTNSKTNMKMLSDNHVKSYLGTIKKSISKEYLMIYIPSANPKKRSFHSWRSSAKSYKYHVLIKNLRCLGHLDPQL